MKRYQIRDKAIEQQIRRQAGLRIIDDITDETLESITTLSICNDCITSLVDLTHCANLTTLDMSGCMLLCDVHPLAEIPKLRNLYLFGTGYTDIELLSHIPLHSLSLGRCYPSDLSPISKSHHLRELDLSENDLSDIGILSGLSLEMLDISANRIHSVLPLSGMTSLCTLNIAENGISDITALSTLSGLVTLDMHSNMVFDISALKGLPNLKKIDSYDNPIDPWLGDIPEG